MFHSMYVCMLVYLHFVFHVTINVFVYKVSSNLMHENEDTIRNVRNSVTSTNYMYMYV